MKQNQYLLVYIKRHGVFPRVELGFRLNRHVDYCGDRAGEMVTDLRGSVGQIITSLLLCQN